MYDGVGVGVAVGGADGVGVTDGSVEGLGVVIGPETRLSKLCGFCEGR